MHNFTFIYLMSSTHCHLPTIIDLLPSTYYHRPTIIDLFSSMCIIIMFTTSYISRNKSVMWSVLVCTWQCQGSILVRVQRSLQVPSLQSNSAVRPQTTTEKASVSLILQPPHPSIPTPPPHAHTSLWERSKYCPKSSSGLAS